MNSELTGVGVVHALGIGVDEFWRNLVSGQCGFTAISEDRRGASVSKVGAELRGFTLGQLFKKGRALDRLWPRPIQLGLAAAALALKDAGVDVAQESDRIGLIVGTSVGNLATAFSFRDDLQKAGRLPAHTAFYCFHHSIASVIGAELDLRGPCYTISQGCNSGIDSAGLAVSMINNGQCDFVLVVGTDNELSPEVFAALEGSGSLSSRFNDRPAEALRPFDMKRDGNVLGEGACAYLLESPLSAERRKARSYAAVSGFAVSSAGGGRQYSATDPDLEPRTFKKAIRQCLQISGDDGIEGSIAICANGSGSRIYDKLEAVVLSELLSENAEHQVFSIKGAVGQHGAPSAALQVVSAALSLWYGSVPPTLNCDEPIIEASRLNIKGQSEPLRANRILCNSIGLGGFFYSTICLASVDRRREGPPLTRWGRMRLELADQS